jgi:predicted DNA-binding protein (UPF0251 family)
MPPLKKRRRITNELKVEYYKPRGIELRNLEEVELIEDEVEAMRLVDYLNMNMDDAAKEMNVSKPTICRMVNSGRHKIAQAIFKGQAIKILTINNMPNFDGTGPEGKGPMTGRGYGKCEGAKGAKNSSDQAARPLGRGMGRGLGLGRGRGRASR